MAKCYSMTLVIRDIVPIPVNSHNLYGNQLQVSDVRDVGAEVVSGSKHTLFAIINRPEMLSAVIILRKMFYRNNY